MSVICPVVPNKDETSNKTESSIVAQFVMRL